MQIPFAASDKCIARKQLTQYSGLCDDDEDDDDHYYDGDQSVYDHEYDDHTAGQQVLGIKQSAFARKQFMNCPVSAMTMMLLIIRIMHDDDHQTSA